MKLKLIFIIGLFLFQSKAKDDRSPIAIDIKVEREYEVTKSKDNYIFNFLDNNYLVEADSFKQKYFDISLTFKNTSDRQVEIWLMKCSFEDNLLVNNNYIFIKGHECDSNFPFPVKFKPGESKTYKLTLVKSIRFDYPCQYCVFGPQVEETKIGLIVIDDYYEPNYNILSYDLAMEDKSKWTIVWSNSLKLLGKQPEPIEIK
ncbi:MAG: hypothetical protein NVV82_12055 [Sporocytophaga sp.]|nr:hypothetical protein [Sporocytophaga sp.]